MSVGTGIDAAGWCPGARFGALPARWRSRTSRRSQADGVRWEDDSFEHVDAILWATAFRPAVDHLAPLGLLARPGATSGAAQA
jgi:hypothetical protein